MKKIIRVHPHSSVSETMLAEKITQFCALCLKATSLHQTHRLWNWADHQSSPEMYWEIIYSLCDWAIER